MPLIPPLSLQVDPSPSSMMMIIMIITNDDDYDDCEVEEKGALLLLTNKKPTNKPINLSQLPFTHVLPLLNYMCAFIQMVWFSHVVDVGTTTRWTIKSRQHHRCSIHIFILILRKCNDHWPCLHSGRPLLRLPLSSLKIVAGSLDAAKASLHRFCRLSSKGSLPAGWVTSC